MDENNIELEVGWWKKPSPFTPTGAWQALDEEFPGDYSAQPRVSVGPLMISCYFQPCDRKFITEEPVHQEAKYICRLHTPPAPNSARFQTTQFDKGLKAKKK